MNSQLKQVKMNNNNRNPAILESLSIRGNYQKLPVENQLNHWAPRGSKGLHGPQRSSWTTQIERTKMRERETLDLDTGPHICIYSNV